MGGIVRFGVLRAQGTPLVLPSSSQRSWARRLEPHLVVGLPSRPPRSRRPHRRDVPALGVSGLIASGSSRSSFIVLSPLIG
jgi:hypothetical protein